jgi:hypothetical protein
VQILEFLSYRNSCKKFLRKRLKTGFFKTPPKPRSCEEIPPKKQEKKRNPQESWQERILGVQKRIPENRNRRPSVWLYPSMKHIQGFT